MREVKGLPTRYRIISPIGQGGMGSVYKVFDSVIERELALKLLSSRGIVSKDFLRREFEILSKLNHPNLVKVHNLGFASDETPFFTMDLVEGINIKSFLAETSNDSYFQAVLRSILSALHYLHVKEIYHGDIKPDNILISNYLKADIHVTLLDFGLAVNKPVPEGKISGTMAFIAPELLSGGKHTASSDLFSLGMTLISSLTDIEIPLPGMLDDAFYRQAYSLLEKRLSSSRVANPSSTASLIISLCQTDPSMRPGKVQDCLKSLPFFGPGREKSPTNFENIFVNRKDELARLDSFLDRSNPEINTILLKGRTGIGKKSLINKTLVSAQLRNYLTVDFSSPRHNTDPLDCFINLLGENLTEESKNNLLRSHNDILRSLGSVDLLDTSSIRENRSNLIHDNIVQYVHDLSISRPVLVSIPALERFGIDFLEFVHHFIYESNLLGSKVRILISIDTDNRQSNAKSSYIEKINSRSSVSKMDIKPFIKDETTLFISESFGVKIFSENQINIMHNLSGGIPLFLSMLLQHCISVNILHWDGTAWSLDHDLFKNFKAPDTLGDMIDISLKHLDYRKCVILQTLSVFKEPVPIDEFISFLGSGNDLSCEINNLKNNHQVDIVNGYLDFSNPLYRQIVLKNLSSGIRSKLSNKIARYMMLNHPEKCVEITRYLLEAKEPEECIRFGIEALSFLSDKHQYHEIYELSSSLYDLTKIYGSLSQQIHFLKILSHAEVMIGSVEDAASHFSILAECENNPSDKSLYLKYLGWIKEFYLTDREGAHKDYDVALKYARVSGNVELVAEILMLQGYSLTRKNSVELLQESADLIKNINADLYIRAISIIIYVSQLSGDIEQMRRYIRELQLLSETSDIKDTTKIKTYNILYLVSFLQGDYSTAKYYVDEMINLSKHTLNELDNISNLEVLGGLFYIEGKYLQMIDTLNEALSLAKRFGVSTSMIMILQNLSGVYRILADYGQSMNVVEEAESLLSNSTVRNVNLTIYLKPLSLYIQLGDHFSAKIEHYSRKLREKAQRNSDQIMLGHRQLALSRYHYQKLAFKKGITFALKALSHFSSSNDRDDIVDSLSHLAVYEVEKGDIDSATGHVKEARVIFDEIHCEYLRPYLLFAEGMVARAKGEAASAGILEDALSTSKRMGTREITWQIQRQLALLFLDSDDIQTSADFYRDSIESIKQITESIPDDGIKMSYLSLPFRKRVFDEIKTLRSK